MRRKRGSATRAIRDDLVSLIKQTRLGYLFESPPLRLDIIVVVSDVRMFHVDPITDALGHPLPLALILPDALFALLDKRLYAVFFYILFSVHVESLFDLEFDGQTVGIPTCFADDVITLHRLVTRYDVFHDTRKDMTDMRLAVCGRGSVIERERRFAFVQFNAFFKNRIFLPEFEHLFFSRTEIEARANLFIHFILRLRKKLFLFFVVLAR